MGLLRDLEVVDVLVVLNRCYAVAVNVSLLGIYLVGRGDDGGEHLLLKGVFAHEPFFFNESVDFLVRLVAHGRTTRDVEYVFNKFLKNWVAVPSLVVVVAHACSIKRVADVASRLREFGMGETEFAALLI